MQPFWSEDLSTFALEQIANSQTENKTWYKGLRIKIRDLMDSKLAKRIGPEEYATSRQLANEEMAECTRRERILREEVLRRRYESYQLKHR